MSDMRPLIAVAPLICAFVCLCPKHVEALSCAAITSRNFDRVDGDADPAKKQQDAEARAALAMLRPIIFRGRLLGPRASVADIGPARELSGGKPTDLSGWPDLSAFEGGRPSAAVRRDKTIARH
jgi:hypothetical protein